MSHQGLQEWVDNVARLTEPAGIHWCDGSEAEIERLNSMMVADGTLIELDSEPSHQ